MSQSKWFRFLTLVILIGTLLSIVSTGCSSGPATPAATSAPASASTASTAPAAQATKPAAAPAGSTTAATSAPAAAATAKGTLRVACAIDANNFDPIKITVVEPEQNAQQQIYDALVYRNDDMSIVPGLAESWKQIDGTTWEFKLRKGVKFHNGEVFNAAAAKYSFDRALDPANKSMDFFTGAVGLSKCEIVDDNTIKLITKKPAAAFLVRLWLFAMVPPKYFAESTPETLATKPIGSGPYKFVEWVKNDHITLEANPDYWGPKPTIKTMTWKVVPEAATRLAMLKSGDVEIADAITSDMAKSLANNPDVRAEVVPGGRRDGIGLTFGKGFPTEDKRVRQALAYAIDYDTILKALYQPNPPVHRFNAVADGKDVSPDVKPYTYDVAKAKQLLADAGFPNGFEAELVYQPAHRQDVIQAICDYWAKVGVKVKITTMDFATYQPLLTGKKFTTNMFYYATTSVMEPTSDLIRYSNTDSFQGTNWKNDEFEKTVQAAIEEIDPAKQKELANKAQKILNEEIPVVFLWNNNDLYGVSNKIEWHGRADQRVLPVSAKFK